MVVKKKIIKAIIFDLDGTLIDSDKDIHKIINFMRAKYLNKNKLSITRISHYTSIGGINLIKKTLTRNNSKFYLDVFRELYLNQKISKNLILPGVISILEFLKKKNIKIYICTNKPKNLTSKIVKNTILNKFVDKYFCADEYKIKKPDNAFFYKIINKIKINKHQIIYIGDSLVDYNFCKNSVVEFFLYKNKRIKYPHKIYSKLLKLNKVIFDYMNSNNFKKIISM